MFLIKAIDDLFKINIQVQHIKKKIVFLTNLLEKLKLF